MRAGYGSWAVVWRPLAYGICSFYLFLLFQHLHTKRKNKCDGVVVRASALQLVDQGFISTSRVIRKYFKNIFHSFPAWRSAQKGIVWRTIRQACLLCPWARHLTGCLHLYVADRWPGHVVYSSWRPSLTEDSQAEHELLRSVCTSSCIMLSPIAQTTTTTQKKLHYVPKV